MIDRKDESIYLLDMASCEPANAISRKFEPGKWTAADYRIEAGDGCMLFCGAGVDAPPIRLNLDVQGWFHIYVATYTWLPGAHCLLLKLNSDAGYTRVTPVAFRPGKDLVPPEMLTTEMDLAETYWKSADLAGRHIIFHRPEAGMMGDALANIAYVRLVKMSEAERKLQQKLKPGHGTRRLVATYDGGQHFVWGYGTHDQVVDEFQALADSDFKMILWGCARALAAFYPSRVVSQENWTPGLELTRHALATKERRCHLRFDPLRSAVQCARDIGIEIFPQVRMTGNRPPPLHLGYAGPGDFHFQHPEWRCRTMEGYDALHLSHAFREVRAKYVELFREWVDDYEAGGVCIVFMRSFPYVLYEEPVTRAFKDKYGLDMKALDRFDERVLAHRAHYLTELLRQTRRMLDEVGERRGRRLGTCYVIPGDAYTDRGCPDLGPFTTPWSLGIDIETWVREGLVDHLVVHLEGVGTSDASDRPPLIKPYVDLAKGKNTQVYADLYPRRQSPDSLRVRAMACYDAGVDGLGFWDCNSRPTRLAEWAMHRVLGHKDDLPELEQFALELFRVVPLVSLDGIMVQHRDCQPTDG